MIKYNVLFIISFLFLLNAFCVVAQSSSKQSRKLDSLNSVLSRLNSSGEFKTTIKGQNQGIALDTIRITTLNDLAWELRYNNVDTAIILSAEALALSQELLKSESTTSFVEKTINKYISTSYLQLGAFYALDGNYPLALDYNLKSLKISESLNDKPGIFASFINIGRVYNRQGNPSEALNYYFKALQNAEKLRNKKNIALSFGKIGVVYDEQGNYSKALEYYSKALKIHEELKDKYGISANLANMGLVYKEQLDYPKAREFYLKALKLCEELEDRNGIAIILGNLANIYKYEGNYEEALKLSFKALQMEEKIGDKEGIIVNLGNIGIVYTEIKKYNDAEKYLKKALAIATDIGSLEALMKVEDQLCALYEKTNKPAEALKHFKKYIVAKDSVFNEDNTQKIVRAEMNFEFEKKQALTKAEQEKKDAITLQEKQKQKNILIFIFCFLILVVIFASLIFNRWRITQKQKLVIEKQKEKIVDSITYAQLIQESILKKESEIQKHLPDSFVYFQPKDIVSGDFYWFSKVVRSQESEQIIIAAVDCTGHGVPGAFMSMIGNTLLNQIVNERKITVPSEILQLLHQGITDALHQEKEGSLSHDGMDIALCCIDYFNNQIQFAGAQNPLYLVSGNKLQEIKGDIYSIGSNVFLKNSNVKIEFTNHSLPLEKGTCIYMFTDGYTDQFGGSNNKKLGTTRFREFLLTIQHLSLPQQKEALVSMLNDWKGGYPQIDDILVVGIKI